MSGVSSTGFGTRVWGFVSRWVVCVRAPETPPLFSPSLLKSLGQLAPLLLSTRDPSLCVEYYGLHAGGKGKGNEGATLLLLAFVADTVFKIWGYVAALSCCRFGRRLRICNGRSHATFHLRVSAPQVSHDGRLSFMVLGCW